MDSEAIRFSLIVATLGRTSELKRFLESVEQQSHRNVEVLVVDQNRDDRIAPILSPYQELFLIKHLRSATGLSRARNVALRHVGGDVIAFPDDDCWYPRDLLELVTDALLRNLKYDGMVGRTVDPSGRPSVGRWDTDAGCLSRSNVWRRGNSSSLFLKQNVVEAVGGFDETLGVGSGTRWGAGEDPDYILRVLASGYRLQYDPSLTIFHQEPVQSYRSEAALRGYRYGSGMGRVLRKHGYSISEVAYHLFRPLAGSLIALLRGRLQRARYHWAVFRGRARGWLS